MKNLIEKRNELSARINALSGVENRSNEETAELDSALEAFDGVDAEIVRQEKTQAINAKLAEPTARKVLRPGSATVAAPKSAEGKLDAFISALPRGQNAIMNAAADVFQEAAQGDGGYLLPVDKRSLLTLIAPPTMIHSQCDLITTNSNATSVPVDEDTVWSTSLAAADVAEGAAMVEQKSAFKILDVALVKSGVLTRVTSEMLEDNTGIGQVVVNKLANKLAWLLHAKCITACLASPAKVTVAKTVGALAGSAPTLENVQKIWVSMLPEMRTNACWVANPQLETALQNLRLADANGNVFPVYIPAGGVSEAPYAKLFGRPVMFIEGLPAVGTEGDLMLCDPSSFYLLLKTSGPRIESSIHAEFANDVVVYRSFIRAAIKSKFSAKIVRSDATEAGNAVTVATRA